MKTRLDFSTIPIGTKVCCALFGNGEIEAIHGLDNSFYKVLVDFDGKLQSYTSDGRYYVDGVCSLRLGHHRFKIGEPYPDFDYVDEDEIKTGDWCFAWDNDRIAVCIRDVKAIHNNRYMDVFGLSWDNWVKIPADMLEQIKELTKLGQ